MAQTPRPDPALVQAAVQHLQGLVDTPSLFAGALVDNVWWIASARAEDGGNVLHEVTDQDWAMAAAFRQEAVVRQSLKAARRSLQDVEKDLGHPPVDVPEPLWRAHAHRYLEDLQLREDLFKAVINGVAARDLGTFPAHRNPRRRAEHILAQRNLSEQIPAGEIVRLTALERCKR